MPENMMRFEEKTIYKLRSLYRKHGYFPYKMSKFEEYELYSRHKDFLVSDRVITFNDTNGKLMALKPDVTFSIIKNGEDSPGNKQKVFYNENVYRVSENTHCFKEILQTGLECIGDITIYDIYEVITLAAQSLVTISENFYIEVSNLDIVYGIVSGVCNNPDFVQTVLNCISQKNTHDLKKACESYQVSEDGYATIAQVISAYGDRNRVLSKLQELSPGSEVERMSLLSAMLDSSDFGDKIRFDFSVINDRNYYNGFVFKGFVDGVCCSVLAGGQYDNMMRKMNRTSGAVGFALYLDRLDELNRDAEPLDIDILLLYNDKTSAIAIADKVKSFVRAGVTVSAQKSIPEKLRYREICDLRQ